MIRSTRSAPLAVPPRHRAARQTADRLGRRHAGVAVLVVGLFVAGMLFAAGPEANGHGPLVPVGPAAASGDLASTGPIGSYRRVGWVAEENARTGTPNWQIPSDPRSWDRIRGYANRASVNTAQSFTIFVTTMATWHVEAYRIGYYAATGGRLIWTSADQPARVQPVLTDDTATGMREAHWTPSLDVHADASWPPGVYLLKLVSADNGASYIPMVIRDDESTAAVLVQSSVTTWQAYNTFGGASLYAGSDANPRERAKVVSFDRPYEGTGSGEFFGREREFVWFAEQHGLDLTYWTDLDLHEQPQRVRQHRAFVSLGHDEYYSNEMRRGLQAARDGGVNLLFLGANAIFRKIRLEPSSAGPTRHEVNYRDPRLDPMIRSDPTQVTVSWRDAPSNDPESALLGNFYECNPVKGDMVIADAAQWMFAGSGLHNGDRLPGVVGNEYDRVTPERPTPANIDVVAHSPVTCRNKPTFADASYYTAASGAGVFDLGTFWWIPKLVAVCPTGPSSDPACQIQDVVWNLLSDFAIGPAAVRHPSVSNLAALGIRPGYLNRGRPPEHLPPGSAPPAASPATTAPSTAPAPSTDPPTTLEVTEPTVDDGD